MVTGSWTPRSVVYWICTGLIALSNVWGGASDVARVPQVVAGMTRLGYPPHFVMLLGVWKILGGLAIVAPGLPRLKEWAYAGIVFDLTGAAIAHAATAESDAWMSNTAHIVTPLVLCALALASWALRPVGRRL